MHGLRNATIGPLIRLYLDVHGGGKNDLGQEGHISVWPYPKPESVKSGKNGLFVQGQKSDYVRI